MMASTRTPQSGVLQSTTQQRFAPVAGMARIIRCYPQEARKPLRLEFITRLFPERLRTCSKQPRRPPQHSHHLLRESLAYKEAVTCVTTFMHSGAYCRGKGGTSVLWVGWCNCELAKLVRLFAE